MQSEKNNVFIPIKIVAKMLEMKPEAITMLSQKGVLPNALRIEGQWVFRKSELDQALKQRRFS